jgi:hypothetical protein
MTAEYEPTADQRALVESASAFGITQAEIANQLGIDEKTLRKHFRVELNSGKFKVDMTAGKTPVELMKSRDECERSEDEYPFWSRPEFGPFPAISQERICHYDELSHDRCNGDFPGFSCANELIVFCLETGIAPRCDQSWHVDGLP